MKIKLGVIILTFILGLYCNTSYCHDEWVAAYPVVETPLVPAVTYITHTVPINYVTYRWVPVYVNRPVIINNYGIFCRKQYVVYQPTIEWIYQPYYFKQP